jgi:hypothetical protein
MGERKVIDAEYRVVQPQPASAASAQLAMILAGLIVLVVVRFLFWPLAHFVQKVLF